MHRLVDEEVSSELVAIHWMKVEGRGRIDAGGLVIVNTADRPCLRLVAVVVEAGSSAKYISRELDRPVGLYAGDEAPVERFGVDLFLSPCGGLLAAVQTRTTEATYADGKPRKWQDESFQVIEVASWVAPALRGEA